jgi:hypothetical protein
VGVLECAVSAQQFLCVSLVFPDFPLLLSDAKRRVEFPFGFGVAFIQNFLQCAFSSSLG